MRITIVQGAFFPVPPRRGGAIEKAWFALGQEFARHGHKVTHFSRNFPGLPEQETISGVKHIRIQGYNAPRSLFVMKWLDLLYSLRAWRVLPEADILVTNTFWLPLLVRSSRQGKLYVHVARTPKGQLFLYRHAARLQTVSQASLQILSQEAGYLIPKCRVIHYPISRRSDQFTIPAPTGKREKRLLYVGRIHSEKGIGLLLDALVLIPAEVFCGWSLRLAGPTAIQDGGGGELYLKRLKNQAGLCAVPVIWTGPIFDPEMLTEEYRRAALFIYPSLAERGETFGLAPLEAMAEGCPALVSDLACFREFITEGQTGFVFNHRSPNPAAALAEKISMLVRQPSLLQETGRRAFTQAGAFALDRVANRYLEDFASLLTDHPTQRI